MAEARLAISNICWPDGAEAHAEAIDTLARLEVPAIDIAPTKVWPNIVQWGADSVSSDDIVAYTATLGGRKIAGFQSLGFGIPGSIFDSHENRNELYDRLRGIVSLAGSVGARTVISAVEFVRERYPQLR